MTNFGTSTLESQNFISSPNDLKALTGFSSCLESAIPDWSSSTFADYCTWSGSKRLARKICESLAGLDQLRVLNHSHNFFTGSLPDNLFLLQHLEVFKLSNNFFSGEIPGNLGNCSSLKHLSINGNDLSDNKLSGSLSEGLGKISKLVDFDISSNEFYGILPNIFGSLRRLKFFSTE
ncbi:Phytosulfokine receptor 1 [Glycine soja]